MWPWNTIRLYVCSRLDTLLHNNLTPLDRYSYLAQATTLQTASNKLERMEKKRDKNNFPFHCASPAKMCRRHIVSLWRDSTTEMSIILHHNFPIYLPPSLSQIPVRFHITFWEPLYCIEWGGDCVLWNAKWPSHVYIFIHFEYILTVLVMVLHLISLWHHAIRTAIVSAFAVIEQIFVFQYRWEQ